MHNSVVTKKENKLLYSTMAADKNMSAGSVLSLFCQKQRIQSEFVPLPYLSLHFTRALEIYSAFLGSEGMGGGGVGGWVLRPAGIGSGGGNGDQRVSVLLIEFRGGESRAPELLP